MHVSRSRSDPRLAQGGSVGVEKTRLWFAARAGKKELEGLAQIQKVCPDPASRDDGVLPRRAPEASHKTLRLPLPPRLPFFLELSAAEYRPPEFGKNTVYVDKSSSDNCRKMRNQSHNFNISVMFQVRTHSRERLVMFSSLVSTTQHSKAAMHVLLHARQRNQSNTS